MTTHAGVTGASTTPGDRYILLARMRNRKLDRR